MAKSKKYSAPVSNCGLTRHSRRRDIVMEVFSCGKSHLNAEQVYKAAQRRMPGIGMATVYRALKYLCACGKLSEFTPADGVARYELSLKREHHDHLVCTVCGAFIEDVEPEIERLQKRLAAKHNFTILNHKLEIYGICAKCAKKK